MGSTIIGSSPFARHGRLLAGQRPIECQLRRAGPAGPRLHLFLVSQAKSLDTREDGSRAQIAKWERLQPMGFGRCRMSVLADASGDSLRAFLVDNVEPGATVITEGWPPY
jgi:hypothetical protein